jgi:hypothetical protein
MRRLVALAVVGAALLVFYIALDQLGPVAPTASPAPSLFAGAYRRGSCVTTPDTTWGVGFTQNGRRMPGGQTRVILVGGRLATPTARNLTVGSSVYLAAAPRLEIRLRATRLDRDATPLDLTATGYPTGEIYSDAWDTGWYYRISVAAVDVLPTSAGCWKVAWLDGADTDVVVVELWGATQSANR